MKALRIGGDRSVVLSAPGVRTLGLRSRKILDTTPQRVIATLFSTEKSFGPMPIAAGGCAAQARTRRPSNLIGLFQSFPLVSVMTPRGVTVCHQSNTWNDKSTPAVDWPARVFRQLSALFCLMTSLPKSALMLKASSFGF